MKNINNWLAENDFIKLPVVNAQWQNLAYGKVGNYMGRHFDEIIDRFVYWKEERSL